MENFGLAVVTLGLSFLVLVPIVAHIHFVEKIVTEDNIPLMIGSFSGLAIILSAIFLGMIQETYVPAGKGRINSGHLFTVVSFLSFLYLGTYLGLAFVIDKFTTDFLTVDDLAEEFRKMEATFRFLAIQCIALFVTYAGAFCGTLYVRISTPSE